jgi:hypothetical protein
MQQVTTSACHKLLEERKVADEAVHTLNSRILRSIRERKAESSCAELRSAPAGIRDRTESEEVVKQPGIVYFESPNAKGGTNARRRIRTTS